MEIVRNGTKVLMTMDNVRAAAAKIAGRMLTIDGLTIDIDKVRQEGPGDGDPRRRRGTTA